MRESSLSEIWLPSFSGSEKGFCRTGRSSGAGGGKWNGREEKPGKKTGRGGRNETSASHDAYADPGRGDTDGSGSPGFLGTKPEKRRKIIWNM